MVVRRGPKGPRLSCSLELAAVLAEVDWLYRLGLAFDLGDMGWNVVILSGRLRRLPLRIATRSSGGSTQPTITKTG
jgi:hypothetical protein